MNDTPTRARRHALGLRCLDLRCLDLRCLGRRWLRLALLLAAVAAGLPAGAPHAAAQSSAPAWLEPRGINIADFVGLVPEAHLQGAIISYEVGSGMLEYISGTRTGDTVTIEARVTPRWGSNDTSSWTTLGCLGQWASFDQWPSAAPAGRVRLYAGGVEITSRIVEVRYARAGLVQPTLGSGPGSRNRYPLVKIAGGATPMRIPANLGCEIIVGGTHRNLTATFTVNAPQRIAIRHLGSETWTMHSYIGEGFAGALGSLATQMQRRFGNRHEKFSMNVPAEADILLFKYPPTRFDAAAGHEPQNANLPGSGTYRLERQNGGLSIDHHNTMGMPIRGQWQDADQAGGDYLPYLTPTVKLTAPEYFLPPGVNYHPCMTSGQCPGTLLDAVYAATYEATVYYYEVQPLTADGLLRVPLRQVGKSWKASAASAPAEPAPAEGAAAEAAPAEAGVLPVQEGHRVWLPLVTRPVVQKPVIEDRQGCPCGWFDAEGRQLDFIRPAN